MLLHPPDGMRISRVLHRGQRVAPGSATASAGAPGGAQPWRSKAIVAGLTGILVSAVCYVNIYLPTSSRAAAAGRERTAASRSAAALAATDGNNSGGGGASGGTDGGSDGGSDAVVPGSMWKAMSDTRRQ